jgi:hypothetical protein
MDEKTRRIVWRRAVELAGMLPDDDVAADAILRATKRVVRFVSAARRPVPLTSAIRLSVTSVMAARAPLKKRSLRNWVLRPAMDAATDLADILKPKTSGETINVHVVESAKEPQPDFESMRRTIEGGTLT